MDPHNVNYFGNSYMPDSSVLNMETDPNEHGGDIYDPNQSFVGDFLPATAIQGEMDIMNNSQAALQSTPCQTRVDDGRSYHFGPPNAVVQNGRSDMIFSQPDTQTIPYQWGIDAASNALPAIGTHYVGGTNDTNQFEGGSMSSTVNTKKTVLASEEEAKYQDKCMKNNEAARKFRSKKRSEMENLKQSHDFIQQQNITLQSELTIAKAERDVFKSILLAHSGCRTLSLEFFIALEFGQFEAENGFINYAEQDYQAGEPANSASTAEFEARHGNISCAEQAYQAGEPANSASIAEFEARHGIISCAGQAYQAGESANFMFTPIGGQGPKHGSKKQIQEGEPYHDNQRMSCQNSNASTISAVSAAIGDQDSRYASTMAPPEFPPEGGSLLPIIPSLENNFQRGHSSQPLINPQSQAREGMPLDPVLQEAQDAHDAQQVQDKLNEFIYYQQQKQKQKQKQKQQQEAVAAAAAAVAAEEAAEAEARGLRCPRCPRCLECTWPLHVLPAAESGRSSSGSDSKLWAQ